jgi:xylulokinase
VSETLTLGIDFGTSAVKVVALAPDGTVVAHATAAYETHKPSADRAEQVPEDWWQALCQSTRHLMALLGDAPIAAAGLSGQLNGIVLVDADGQVLERSLIWLDQRATEEANELERLHGRSLSVTASPMSPIAVLPKLLWLKRHRPELLQRARHIFQVKDYIFWRLTGKRATDANEASATSLMGLATRRWDQDLIDLAGVDARQLSPIEASARIAGEVTPPAARETGLPEGLGVAPGAGDTGALAVGCGAYAKGTVAVTLGTAGHVVAAVENRPLSAARGLWRMAHVTPDRELWLGLVPAGGLSIAWLLGVAEGFIGRRPSFDELERLVETAPPGAAGAYFLPFLEGAGTPWNDPSRAAVLGGMNVSHGAAHLVRAVYEGVAFNIRAALECFEREGVHLQRIHLAEGGVQSAAWCQIIANALDREVHVVAERDTSAVGAAILARCAASGQDLDDLIASSVRISRSYRPDPEATAAMKMSLARFRAHAGRPG